jgi:uncharacterized protein
MSQLDEVVLSIDELEALRLADLEGLYQEEAAKSMGVSRQTFGRIVTAARRKTAEALVGGKALKIDGGEFRGPELRTFGCGSCGCEWQVQHGTGRPSMCPKCSSESFRRVGSPKTESKDVRQPVRGRPKEG